MNKNEGSIKILSGTIVLWQIYPLHEMILRRVLGDTDININTRNLRTKPEVLSDKMLRF